MKKLSVLMMIALFGLTVGSCSSDDKTVDIDKPAPTEDVLEKDYKTSIIGEWKWVNIEFLDKDKKVFEVRDLSKTGKCGVDTWKFNEEIMEMNFNYEDEYGDCKVNVVKPKYNVNEGNLFILYPSQDSFIPKGYSFASFKKKRIVIQEHVTYTEVDNESFGYPKETVYVQFVLIRE